MKRPFIIATILTLGEKSNLDKRISEIEVLLRQSGVDFTIQISLNKKNRSDSRQLNTPTNVKTIEYQEFHDSVEEHLLNYLEYESTIKREQKCFIFPISDGDDYNDSIFINFFKSLNWSQNELIFFNHVFSSKYGLISDKTISALGNSNQIRQIQLNSGPTQAFSKLGAWLISSNLLNKENLAVWRAWVSKTILFTHSYFFLFLATRSNATLVVDEEFLIVHPNPTDEDKSDLWLNYYKRQNKLFQNDWTFGQLYLLKSLYEMGLLTHREIKAMVISCSQRGVLPLFQDLIFRIRYNQLDSMLQKRPQNAEFIMEQLEFAKMIWPEFNDIFASLSVLANSSESSLKLRLASYKNVISFYDYYAQSPWLFLKVESYKSFDIYRRSHSYLAVRKGVQVNLAMRNSSQNLENSDMFHSASLDQLRSWIEGNKASQFAEGYIVSEWKAPSSDFYLGYPRLQLMVLRMHPRVRMPLMNFGKKIRKFLHFARKF